MKTTEDPNGGSLERMVRRMWIVERFGWGKTRQLVAIFASRGMAEEWTAQADHRRSDIISEADIETHPPNDKVSDERH